MPHNITIDSALSTRASFPRLHWSVLKVALPVSRPGLREVPLGLIRRLEVSMLRAKSCLVGPQLECHALLRLDKYAACPCASRATIPGVSRCKASATIPNGPFASAIKPPSPVLEASRAAGEAKATSAVTA